MTEPQRLFAAQAKSDFAIFELLNGQPNMPSCHPLHYLQMAAEMLGKAHSWGHGPNSSSHRAFVGLVRSLKSNRKAQDQMRYQRKNEQWKHLINRLTPLAEQIEDLAPALSPDGPNPEYPWPRAQPKAAPVEHDFELAMKLRNPDGQQFLKFLRELFEQAEAFL